jgi:predicted TIM-barrel fold metal-dependent hydrolase
MGAPLGWVPPAAVLAALQERGLIFELLARPDSLAEAATRFAGADDLPIVVEHAGWPASAADDERATWEDGMRALAATGPNVHCKLSGLVGATGSMTAAAFAPWIETAIDLFGVDRCFFAGNFPVDGLHGTLDQLWSSYAEVVSGEDQPTVDALFATNAERLYRI